jgi:hypothetical protein
MTKQFLVKFFGSVITAILVFTIFQTIAHARGKQYNAPAKSGLGYSATCIDETKVDHYFAVTVNFNTQKGKPYGEARLTYTSGSSEADLSDEFNNLIGNFSGLPKLTITCDGAFGANIPMSYDKILASADSYS